MGSGATGTHAQGDATARRHPRHRRTSSPWVAPRPGDRLEIVKNEHSGILAANSRPSNSVWRGRRTNALSRPRSGFQPRVRPRRGQCTGAKKQSFGRSAATPTYRTGAVISAGQMSVQLASYVQSSSRNSSCKFWGSVCNERARSRCRGRGTSQLRRVVRRTWRLVGLPANSCAKKMSYQISQEPNMTVD